MSIRGAKYPVLYAVNGGLFLVYDENEYISMKIIDEKFVKIKFTSQPAFYVLDSEGSLYTFKNCKKHWESLQINKIVDLSYSVCEIEKLVAPSVGDLIKLSVQSVKNIKRRRNIKGFILFLKRFDEDTKFNSEMFSEFLKVRR